MQPRLPALDADWLGEQDAAERRHASNGDEDKDEETNELTDEKGPSTRLCKWFSKFNQSPILLS